MDIIAQITIGPSDHEEHAVDYATATPDSEGYLSTDDSGGYPLARGRHPVATDGWVRAARKHVGLPVAVILDGQGWADAEVRPFGWSEGAGHAPGGVELVWRKGGGR